MSTTKAKKGQATIQDVPGGYHLVTYGEWQVSVMNDGMISLPRIVRPQDIDDFCAAMEAAKEVGLKQIEQNEKLAKEQMSRAVASKEARRAEFTRVNRAKTRREANSAKAKAVQQARAGGPRGARKTQSEKADEKES